MPELSPFVPFRVNGFAPLQSVARMRAGAWRAARPLNRPGVTYSADRLKNKATASSQLHHGSSAAIQSSFAAGACTRGSPCLMPVARGMFDSSLSRQSPHFHRATATSIAHF